MRNTSSSRFETARNSVTMAKVGMMKRSTAMAFSSNPSGARVVRESPFSAPIVKRIGIVR